MISPSDRPNPPIPPSVPPPAKPGLFDLPASEPGVPYSSGDQAKADPAADIPSHPEGELSDSIFQLLLPEDSEEEPGKERGEAQGAEIASPPMGLKSSLVPPKLPGNLAASKKADIVDVPPRRDSVATMPPRFERRSTDPVPPLSYSTVAWMVLGIGLTLLVCILIALLLFAPSRPRLEQGCAKTRIEDGTPRNTGSQNPVPRNGGAFAVSRFPVSSFSSLPPLFFLQANPQANPRAGTTATRTPFPGTSLSGHSGKIVDLAYSGDGKILATVSSDRTVIIRDGLTGNPNTRMEGRNVHKSPITTLFLNRDGSVLWTGSRDKTVCSWATSSGTKLSTLATPAEVRSLALTPDGSFVIAGLENGACCVWDARLGNEINLLRLHTKAANRLAVRPGRLSLAVASDDKQVSVWSPQRNTPTAVFKGHEDAITAIAFQPGSDRIASVAKDRTIILWEFDPRTSATKEVQTYRGHTAQVDFLAFSSDGSTLLSAGGDRRVIQWNAVTAERIAVFEECAGPNVGGAVRPDFQRLALLGKNGKASLLTSEELDLLLPGNAPVKRPPPSVYATLPVLPLQSHIPGKKAIRAAFQCDPTAPEGNRLLLSDGGSAISLRDWKTAEPRASLSIPPAILSACMNPDGSAFLTGAPDGSFTAWNSADGRSLRRFRAHSAPVLSLSFSPSGEELLSGSADNTAILWNAVNGQVRTIFRGHVGPVIATTVHPDGKTILTASRDKTLRIWDREGKCLRILRAHEAALTDACFNRAGTLIASVSDDKTVRIWDVLKALNTPNAHDGETGDRGATEDPALWKTFSGFNAETLCARFHPDDRYLAVGSREGRVVFFEMREGTPAWTLELIPPSPALPPGRKNRPPPLLVPEPVCAMDFSIDGSRLYTSGDHSLFVWNLLANTVSTGSPAAPAGSDPYAVLPLGKQLGTLPLPVEGSLRTGPCLSPDGRFVLGILDEKKVLCFQPGPREETEAAPQNHTFPETVPVVCFLDDSTVVAGRGDGRLVLWNRWDDHTVELMKLHGAPVTAIGTDGKGTRILSGDANGLLVLWNNRGDFIGRLNGHAQSIRAAALSPDGSKAISVAEDKRLIVWDLSRMKEAMTFREHVGNGPTALAVENGGTRFASVGKDGFLVLYALTPKPKVVRKIESGVPLDSVAFSPDASLIATGSQQGSQRGRVILWETESGKPVSTLPLQESLLPGLNFSSDGRSLLVAGPGELRVFQIAPQQIAP